MKCLQPAAMGWAQCHPDLHDSLLLRCPRCLLRGCAGRLAETAAGADDPLLMTLVLTVGAVGHSMAARPQHKD